MNDSSDCDIFYNLIKRTFLIESLKDTLDQMVEGYYLTKESSDRILNEAVKEYQITLKNNKHLFCKILVFGQLGQYKYLDNMWTFNLKDPLICYFYSPSDPDEIDNSDDDDSYTPRSRSTVSKEISKNLHSDNYKVFCVKGYLKIMSVEDY
ncbi:uncharacterized protein TOT_040000147 [Theileria orientalis strain Shintoku]|uniref:Transcription initiation factor IIA subunit 2 n=1 Tax=Theileria orientalis strain Shintoku TaxID=869250 RepID=J4DA42_THEOR|nr:uncharacterized protein TOT_040000147 [Theileria orientalis strain Shintoku]PVC53638.1 hypothetical protein MACL_00003674 [Theileria orientalis]BAM41765.1 uncharacterized protein TOT_040000147 [Theileria orientalis strain Shintoku]|eukprot:XP_009692066.1 uncharacterized protein TOT_040000147 [Theileria orientalis strain Shintoku]